MLRLFSDDIGKKMDAGQLKKYRQQLSRRLPLIGGWLQTQAVKTLAEEGSAEAVHLLEEAVIGSEEEALRGAALDSLGQMAANNVAAREALCRLVIKHDHLRANQIVSAGRFVPHDEAHRALAAAMSFADHSAVELERLEAERAAERRRARG